MKTFEEWNKTFNYSQVDTTAGEYGRAAWEAASKEKEDFYEDLLKHKDQLIQDITIQLNLQRKGLVVVPHIRFDGEGFYRFATELLGASPHAAAEWVADQFSRFIEQIDSLKPGDVLVSIETPKPSHKPNRE